MITKSDIIKLPPGIFLQGITMITHPWWSPGNPYNLHFTDNNGKVKVKFVAVKGDGNDFAIYHSLSGDFIEESYLDDDNHLLVPYSTIANIGTKLKNPSDIISILSCGKDVIEVYRY